MIDPAIKYAEDILAGVIPAGQYVVGACRRFLTDLETQDQHQWFYSLEAADKAVAFFGGVLTLSGGEMEGAPFVLSDWQEFVVRNIYGWLRRKDDTRRYRKVYIESGKGSGKSPLVAGMGIRAVCGDNENRAQGYVLAKTADQARVTFDSLVAMVQSSPVLSDRLKVLGGEHPYRIVDHKSHSFIERVTSDHKGKGKSGPIPHIIIVDEYHEHETSAMRDMFAAGVKNRRQPLMIMITNSGVSLRSACGQEHIYACAVALSEIDDDQYFALVFGVEDGDDPMNDEACWIKANPSLTMDPESEAISIPGYDYIRSQVREAKGMPSKRSVVERLNFCRWVEAEAPWIDRDKWVACETADEDLMPIVDRRKYPAWISLDLSQKTDLTAATIAFDMGDHIETETLVWSPSDTLIQRSERDSAPYNLWAEQGYLVATPGAIVDLSFVASWIKEMAETNNIVGVSYDSWRIDLLQAELDKLGVLSDRKPGRGLYMVPHPQGFVAGAKPLADPIDEELLGLRLWMPRSIDYVEEAILNGEVRVKVNPALRMAMAGMIIVADAANNRRPTKSKSLLKIDAGVSFVMAVGTVCAARQGKWKPISDISQIYIPLG